MINGFQSPQCYQHGLSLFVNSPHISSRIICLLVREIKCIPSNEDNLHHRINRDDSTRKAARLPERGTVIMNKRTVDSDYKQCYIHSS